jgi:pyridoxine 5-phosphate synthase
VNKIRLGVNIDHVATIRNARGEYYPEPVRAALLAEKSGADSITIHLREDRRHIRDYDLTKIKKKVKIPLNLEMSPTKEMLNIAIKLKPNFVCVVPEKRKEITTEGGLNLNKNKFYLKKIINNLQKKNIRVSLFIEPKISDIKLAKILKSDCVELHTGNYCNLLIKNKSAKTAFSKLRKATSYAHKLGLEVHAGHGITYKSAHNISRIKNISELNIGHFIISESLFVGLSNSIKKFKKIINN